MATSPPADRLIKLPEVECRVGLRKTMIYRKIQEGSFPAPYKLTPFAARWSEQEITAWIADVKAGKGSKTQG